MSLQVIQDIQEFQLSKQTRKEVAEQAAKVIAFDGDSEVFAFNLKWVFEYLAKGILYVQNTYGMVVDRFYISVERLPNCLKSDEGYADSAIQYIRELDGIFVDYPYLGMMCLGMINNHIHPLVHLDCQGRAYGVNTHDVLFLAGVEEAHHAYFYKSGGAVEGVEVGCRTLEEYRNHPAEKAVAPVIRQAIRDLGMQVYISVGGRAFPCNLPDEADYQ